MRLRSDERGKGCLHMLRTYDVGVHQRPKAVRWNDVLGIERGFRTMRVEHLKIQLFVKKLFFVQMSQQIESNIKLNW